MKQYSRRQFTKLAAAGGICAAVGMLTSCMGSNAGSSASSGDADENGTAESDTYETTLENSQAGNSSDGSSLAGESDTSTSSTDEVPSGSSSESNFLAGSNLLIAYFSCTGTTEQIAGWIASETGADIYEIIPDDPYTEEDLAYYTGGRADQEQADSSARPMISGSVENLEQYHIIFLGYPIWHGQAPRIISTFLESYDFSNVTIIPFCASHSSGIGSSAQNLHGLISDTVTWLDGRRFSGSAIENDVVEWIEGLDLPESEVLAVREFDFETKKVLLNSGYEMPIIGLGTYSLSATECAVSIAALLESGGRLIDTAYMYGNEAAVGQAVSDSDVPREEIFVITKLYPTQFHRAAEAIDEALERMGLDYIDMMLLHHPGNNDVEAYLALEQAVADGKVRSIGLSNWYVEELEEFLPQVNITPALVQNEIHPYYQENDVIPYIQDLGIVVQGWYPLGGRGYTEELLGDETITAIAQTHGVSAAQVILRWNLQKGVVVIPGSSDPEHIQGNLDLYDFELSDEEMAQINTLDRNEKHDWY
ncbi:MAG: aldo/keto reductase [Lachnospiraceae bacterium]|nr:aldo/keto reductase [Lachnospiraceae bacterium]